MYRNPPYFKNLTIRATQSFRVAAGSLYGAKTNQTEADATTGGGDSVGQTKC
jgi:hypothetical protein